MNVGDYVYIYLFDLIKALPNMKHLRVDRFGKIEHKELIQGNQEIYEYSVKLFDSNKIIKIRTDSLAYNIVTLDELIRLLENSNLTERQYNLFMSQIQIALEYK